MQQVDLAAYNNSWYKPGNALKRFCWYFVNGVFFKTSFFPFSGLKVFLLKLFGAKIGKAVLIKPNVNIKYPWYLQIGNHVWIGEAVWIDNLAMVSIGDHVCISQGAFLLCGNHNFKKATFDLIVKPIIIEAGVWLGAKTIVMGGVSCKSHAVLTVASVASNDLEAYFIYSGNPAIKIKERTIFNEN
jgi:putative colanic acid biosynthesis acetyltransferase WcaF